MTDEELESYLPTKEMKRYTPKTVTDREELKKQLKVVAEQGYAIDDEEMDIGSNASARRSATTRAGSSAR